MSTFLNIYGRHRFPAEPVRVLVADDQALMREGIASLLIDLTASAWRSRPAMH
jgi:hypothetical protein